MRIRRQRIESLERRICLDGAGIGALVSADVQQDGGPPSFAGDANCDGAFDTEDFVVVFQAGKYNSGKKASWREGDWNHDDVFDSGDIVTAFELGRYRKGPPDHANGPPADHDNGPPVDHCRPNQGQSAVVEVNGGNSGEIVITSTKDLSNIVYRMPTEDGYMDTKIDDLEGMSYTLQLEGDMTITDLWVKSGNNASGSGPGYGQHFEWNGEAWVSEQPADGDPPCDGNPSTEMPPDDVPRGDGRPDDVPRGDGRPDDVPRGDGQPDDVPRGEGRPDDVPRGDGRPDDVPRGDGRPDDVPRGDGRPDDVPRGDGQPDDVPRGDGRPDDVGEIDTDPPLDADLTDAVFAGL